MDYTDLYIKFKQTLDRVPAEAIPEEMEKCQTLACHGSNSKSEQFFYASAIKYFKLKMEKDHVSS